MIRPLSNRILIDPIYPTQERNGLWVPAETTTFRYDRPNEPATAVTRGKVLAFGPQAKNVAVGDVVQFSDSCGRPVDHDGQKLLFIREDDVALIEG
jgi:co-chaperonin GroES (HSP10)